MSSVVSVLMKRDGMTKDEAVRQKNEVREMILDALENEEYDDIEDIMYGELGLEMDYIDEMLF